MTETRVPIQERIDIWEVIDAAATKPFGFMPFYTANKIAEALNRQGKPLLGAKILVLGIAFKPDIDDARNSPAVALIRTLLGRGADLRYHDPFVPEVHLDEESWPVGSSTVRLRSGPLTDEVLADQDCVCLAVAHSAFDIAWIVKHSRLLVDATGVTRRMSPAGGMVIRL
jgi:UDP-N-acetyl-D-glucosamine dehydrogenase